MSTQSITRFETADGKEAVAVYRHYDGYVEDHGKKILDFMAMPGNKELAQRDDPWYLASRFVYFLYTVNHGSEGHPAHWADDKVDEMLGVGIVPAEWTSCKYIYTVRAGRVFLDEYRYGQLQEVLLDESGKVYLSDKRIETIA